MEGTNSPTGSETENSEDSLTLSLSKAEIKLTIAEMRIKLAEIQCADRERARQWEERKWAHEANMRTTGQGILMSDIRDGKCPKILVPPITDNSNPEIIFAAFEKMARIRKVGEERYIDYLIPALTERALHVFAKLPETQAGDYFAVKKAVLEAFHQTPEDHLNQFRSVKIKPEENYKQFLERLTDHFASWIKGEKASEDIERLKEIVIREQYVKNFPVELRIYVFDREAKTLDEIAGLADRFETARGICRKNSGERRNRPEGQTRVVECLRQRENYPRRAERREETSGGNKRNGPPNFSNRPKREEVIRKPAADVICYKCSGKGHYSSACPVRSPRDNQNEKTTPKNVYFVAVTNGNIPEAYARSVFVNGKKRTGYRDTGAEISLVRPELVLNNQWTGRYIKIVTATGETGEVPTAMVNWTINGSEKVVETAIIKALPFECLVANDIGEHMQAVAYETDGLSQGNYGRNINGAVGDQYEQKMVVQGKYLKVKRDTGSQISIVNAELVSPDEYKKDEYRVIQTLRGGEIKLPLATIKIDKGLGEENISVVVCEKAPYSLLLANDSGHEMRPINSFVVLTRQANRQGQLEKRESVNGLKSDPPRKHFSRPLAGSGVTIPTVQGTLESGESVNEPGPVTAEGHVDPGEGREKEVLVDSELAAIIDKLTSISNKCDLLAAQEADPTLDHIRETISKRPESQVRNEEEQFYMEDGILFRRWKCKRADRVYNQIIVPDKLREPVMYLCHQNKLSGHLGYGKSRDRLTKSFFWPKIVADVKAYIKSCETCQVTRRSKRGLRAPLCRVPIIPQVFYKLAVDLVGPLPVTERENKYLLTVICHASQYPEAIPLPDIETETVIENLITIFTRWGFPHEILSDLGRQFTADITHGLWKRTGVKILHTTPYRPQSNGKLERLHSSLKHMLRSMAFQHQADWDKLVPYALFAYREVPHESTGFSPFELVFGHDVRGPLEILKKTWISDDGEKKPVTTYWKEFRTRLHRMTKLAAKNVKEAQEKTKVWYDKKARQRKLEAGQQVLVLRPVIENSMDIAWDGPFAVTKRVGDLNYEVEIDTERHKRKIYHVNMLKPYVRRNPFVGWLGRVEDDAEKENPQLDIWPCSVGGSHSEPILGDNLSGEQIRELQQVFEGFTDVLRDEPGRTHLENHDIELSHTTPICKKQYRNPWAVRNEINQQVKEMIDSSIIEPSRSKYASPVILVPKKDGSSRFVVDFRLVNQATKFDAYPNSSLSEALAGLGRAKYLTKIDLVRGYWQIPLTERAKEITAFRTEEGLFHFKVMPFGLKNSSASFVRLMDQVLKGLSDHTRYYVDDILIFSNDWEGHLKHIQVVLARLREAGLTAKPSKCSFGVNKVEYLGFEIGPEGICPNEAKVKAIVDWPRPLTKKQVRAFLGVTGYYRQHVKDYSKKAMALTEMTKKNQPNNVSWTEECENAFKLLKESISRKPVLASPDFGREFILQTDASDRGLGAVLCQLDENNVERPLAYLSRKLNPAEQSYATVEKEALAIVWAVERARPFLYGKPFKIVSDHNPLVWMENFKGKNRKILRWVLQLQEYEFEILYRKGSANGNADGLSRRE